MHKNFLDQDKVSMGRTVWIVGATGVIGAESARILAARGVPLAISGRDQKKLKEIEREVLQLGGQCEVIPLDVKDSQAVLEAAKQASTIGGGLAGLVNSTAARAFGDFFALEDSEWDDVLDSKLMGYMRTMRATIPYLRSNGTGAIVNVTGRGGRQPVPAHLPGCCANAAVNLLSKGLADICWASGVRVNVVAPGPVESDRFVEIDCSNAQFSGCEALPIASERLARPVDVARAIAFLLSDDAKHISGTVLAVDGSGTATV